MGEVRANAKCAAISVTPVVPPQRSTIEHAQGTPLGEFGRPADQSFQTFGQRLGPVQGKFTKLFSINKPRVDDLARAGADEQAPPIEMIGELWAQAPRLALPQRGK